MALGLGLTLAVGAYALGRVPAQDQEFTMPAWTQPAPEHAELAKSVGNWDVAYEYAMAPGAPMEKGAGTAKRELILNGMFLKETFNSDFQGTPFEGQLLQGYDTVRKEWVNIWMDSMSPVMSISRGKKDASGTMTFFSEDPDFMTGKLKKTKHVVKNTDADHVQVEMFDIADAGEQLTMRMKYTRKK